MRSRTVWALAWVGLSLAGCSSGGGSNATATDSGADGTTVETLGASGGTVATSGASLDVPAGALAVDTPLSIAVSTDPVPAGYTALSPLFSFSPDGTTFLKPVTVTIAVTSPDATTTVFWSNAAGGYDALPTTVSGGSVSAQVTHFSRGFAGHHGASDGGGSSGSGSSSGGTSSGGSSGAGSSSGSSGSSGGSSGTDSGGGSSSGPGVDSGAGDASSGGGPGIFVNIGGAPMSFTNNINYAGPIQPYFTIAADDTPSLTHWTMSISVPPTASTIHCSPSVYVPAITYSHYTANGDAGVLDIQYTTSNGSDAGSCTIVETADASIQGQYGVGTFSGTMIAVKGDAGPASYTLTGGSYDLPVP